VSSGFKRRVRTRCYATEDLDYNFYGHKSQFSVNMCLYVESVYCYPRSFFRDIVGFSKFGYVQYTIRISHVCSTRIGQYQLDAAWLYNIVFLPPLPRSPRVYIYLRERLPPGADVGCSMVVRGFQGYAIIHKILFLVGI